VIIGVDSGVYRAFAAIDLDGRVVAVESKRNWGETGFIESISPFKPIVIACDVRPSSKTARALASVFSAKLFQPKHSLLVLEKARVTRDYAVKNAHERDALAAALKAFHSMAENKMKQTVRRLREKGISGERLQKVKRLVLKGKRTDKALEETD
jgi:hypothetical protein